MSVTYFRLIPTDPYYVPLLNAQSVAREFLSQLILGMPNVNVEVHATPQFIDQGENFERVSCPFCNKDLRGWWGNAMDKAYEGLFENLLVTLPCCNEQMSLNELQYEMPAGFARFVLEVENPDLAENLAVEDISKIEAILNCSIKQIWSRY